MKYVISKDNVQYKANSQYGYHTTQLSNISNILKKGIIPNENTVFEGDTDKESYDEKYGIDYDPEKRYKKVFFWKTFQNAINHIYDLVPALAYYRKDAQVVIIIHKLPKDYDNDPEEWGEGFMCDEIKANSIEYICINTQFNQSIKNETYDYSLIKDKKKWNCTPK